MASNSRTSLETVNTPQVVRERMNPLRLSWHILRRYPVLPAIIVALLVIAAVFAPWLAPHDPLVGKLRDQDRPPIWQESSPISGKEPLWDYPLGTDPLGRDMLSRIIWGARYSMLIASVVLLSGAIGGTILGLIAGYFGGIYDEILMRMVDLTLGRTLHPRRTRHRRRVRFQHVAHNRAADTVQLERIRPPSPRRDLTTQSIRLRRTCSCSRRIRKPNHLKTRLTGCSKHSSRHRQPKHRDS